ncbi:MAG: hypothetical protein WDL87_00920 [Candidatus Omnitrophota bacterium]|jgi:hypothetical protein
MAHRIKIKLVDIVFEVGCAELRQITWLKKNYCLFVTQDRPDYLVSLQLNKRKGPKDLRYSSCNCFQKSLSKFKTATFDLKVDFCKKKVSVSAVPDVGIVDVLRFLCFVVLLKKSGFLLHASVVLHRGFSYVFFGPSESGKTTIARLSQGSIVLTDETAAILKRKGKFYAYATPFFGDFGLPDENKGAPLKAIFLISKDRLFTHRRLKQADAVKELLHNILVNIPDRAIVNTLLVSLADLTHNVPCYQLYFKQDEAIWRYIDGIIG